MKRRLLAILVVFVLVVSLFPGWNVSGIDGLTESEPGQKIQLMQEESEGASVLVDVEEGMLDENLDGLSQPSESPAQVSIPMVQAAPRDTPKMRSAQIMSADGPVIGQDHPTQPGQVMSFKEAKPVDGVVNVWDVTVRVEAMDTTTTSDIVLVIDQSGSMRGTKLANAKAAAKLFVEKVLDGTTNTRIAVVSFSEGSHVRENFTNNKEDLNDTIDGLWADGGTYTQAGMHTAQGLLSGSQATQKNIVLLSDGQPTYSTRMNSPDDYLVNYQTSANAPATAYVYSSRVGDGTNMLYRYAINPYRYYNHGNSAIAEAGYAKAAGTTVYTIALDAGTDGTAVLNNMASPGKAYQTSNPAALAPIFTEIAGRIFSSASNSSVTDPMGLGFEVEGDLTDISVSQGVVALSGGTIDWDIGSLTQPIPAPGNQNIKYAEMSYRVTINDEILNATAEDGTNYKTNGDAIFQYTDSEGVQQTTTFPQPSVDPILLVVEKMLKDANGNVITDDNRQFMINVKNHVTDVDDPYYYDKYYLLKPGERRVMTNLRLEDTYTVAELPDRSNPQYSVEDYNTTIQVYGETQSTFQIVQGSADSPVLVTNQEKPLGELTIYKVFNPIGTTGAVTGGTPPTFKFSVSGPNGYLNNAIELKAGESHTITGLAYGDYTVTETEANGFVATYNPAGGTVKLTNDVKKGQVTVTNAPDENDTTVDIVGTKIWDGGLDENHTAIPLTLYANGMEAMNPPVPTIVPDQGTSDTFTYTWSGLPKYASNGSIINYTVDEKIVPPKYVRSLSPDKLTVTNTYQESAGKTVKANKIWDGGESVAADRPDIWFKLYRNIDGGPSEEVPLEEAEIKKLASGTYDVEWSDLLLEDHGANTYTYTVKEVDADGNDYTPTDYTKNENGLTVTNTYDITTDTVEAKKIWVNGPSTKPDVWFKLYRNVAGAPATPVPGLDAIKIPASTDSEIPVEWQNVDQTDKSGKPYTFTVKEVDADGNDYTPTNYQKKEDGLTVTNTYQSPILPRVTAIKEWKDGNALTRPVIGFQLHRKTDPASAGEAVTGATIKYLAPGETTAGWDGLRQTDDQGNDYIYFVKELVQVGQYVPGVPPQLVDAAPDGYTKDENLLKVTNTYVVPKVETITATKNWVQGPTDKPTVWFKLYRNIEGAEPEAVPDAAIIELPDETTTAQWNNLDATDIEGNEYTFTVEEVDALGNPLELDNYLSIPIGLTVSNYYIPPVGDITATKTWEFGPADKPTVWFKLYRNIEGAEPEAVADAELKELPSGTETVTWDGLPLNDMDGNTYVYSVIEVDEEGVAFEPENYTKNEEGLTVTNSYVPPTGDITATKTWEFGPADKPTVWFKLYRNIEGAEPEAVADAELKELPSGTETVTWDGLPLNDMDGNTYVYSVIEVDEEGVAFEPENYTKNEEGLTVTNSYVPPTGDITATKTWEFGPADKPTVWFKLYRNIEGGEPEAVEGAELKELPSGTETVTWDGLPLNDMDGNTYVYSVIEVDEEGVAFEPENYTKNEEGLTVTNSYVPPTGDITATKTWEFGPADKPTVWFKLYRNIEGGEPEAVEGAELKELPSGTETVTWDGLPLNDMDGNTYVYSVIEVDEEGVAFEPENYTKNEEGLTVTNSYVPPTGDITATKTWEFGPADKPTVWFKLYRNIEGGEPEAVEGAELKELPSGTETVTWDGLPLNDMDGNTYVYSVIEVDEEGVAFEPENYTKEEDGLKVTNTYVPPTGDITATKEWVNTSGDKPTVWFKLYRNIEGGTPAEVTGASLKELPSGTESVTWEGLPLTDMDGEDYIYSVIETDKDGKPFVPKYFMNDEEGLNITNIYLTPTFIDPPVGKVVSGDKPATDATFVFKMKALDGAPFFEDAVAGERLMEIKGSGTKEFGEIIIAQEGTFTYEISEVDTGEKGYTYDKTVYTMTVEVTLNMDTLSYEKNETIVDSNGEVVEGIAFDNQYKAPPVVVEPTKAAPGTVKPAVTKTGDSSVSTVAVLLLLMSAVTLVIIQRRREAK